MTLRPNVAKQDQWGSSRSPGFRNLHLQLGSSSSCPWAGILWAQPLSPDGWSTSWKETSSTWCPHVSHWLQALVEPLSNTRLAKSHLLAVLYFILGGPTQTLKDTGCQLALMEGHPFWSPKLTCQLLLFIWPNAMQTSSQHHSRAFTCSPGWLWTTGLLAHRAAQSPPPWAEGLFQPPHGAAAHTLVK